MLETLEVSAPPALPPAFTRSQRRDGRYIIIPDILAADQVTRLPYQDQNWITLLYRWMVRIDLENDTMERTIVGTRRYWNWLETYETKDGVSPHVVFGGAIVAGEPDPTFYPRWVEYAKEIFA